MYYYIVDPRELKQREFERVQNVLYSSLSEYRIAGEMVRTSGVRTINQLVENAIAHEAKTIVAVGNDETLHDIVNALQGREIVVGFIPLTKSRLAEIFGIKDILQAVKTIAFRRIELLDLGIVNNNYFLSQLTFGSPDAERVEIKISVNKQFIATHNVTAMSIANIRESLNPSDGLLDIAMLPQLSFWEKIRYRAELLTGQYESIPRSSVLHVKKIEILSPEDFPLKLGPKIIVRTPAMVGLVPGSLRMIVGKERVF